MLPSIFRTAERNLVLEYLDEWKKLKGSGKGMDNEGDLLSLKDELVNQIIQDLFNHFPERDLTRSPQHPLVWEQADRDLLHARVRQLLYNAVYRSKDTIDTPPVPSNIRYISVLTLFKQRYAQEIVARRNELRISTSHKDSLSAYNEAVREIFERLKKERPDELETLEDTVAQLKSSLRQDFQDQPQEVQRAVLDMLPSDIVSSVKAWEKRSGAKIYVMAVWSNTDGVPSAFDYASKSCGRYLDSELGEELRERWFQWMKEQHGGELINDKDQVPPSIYPNAEGWPMLPRLDILKLSMADEKILFRRYFTLISAAMGGTQPSYHRIAEHMKKNPGSYIELLRMPDDFPILRDLRHWVRAEIRAWTKHILDGQMGLLPPEKRFAWRIIPRPAGEPLRIVSSFCQVPVKEAHIRWTKTELLYAKKMYEDDSVAETSLVMWNGLPLARTSHIYSPYSLSLYQHLTSIHSDHESLLHLIQEVARMEQLGPIHRDTSLNDGGATQNPHIPGPGGGSLAQILTEAVWLPAEFFDSSHEQHTAWSLNALKRWISHRHPHIHAASQTVYGGPMGVRNLVFAFSRIAHCVARVGRHLDVPDDIKRIISAPRRRWSPHSTNQALDDCISVLAAQLRESRRILEKSLVERTSAWENEVLRTQTESMLGAAHSHPDSGICATSGVPKSITTLRSMIAIITARRLDAARNANDYDTSITAHQRSRGLSVDQTSYQASMSMEHSTTQENEDDDPDRARMMDESSSTIGSSQAQSDATRSPISQPAEEEKRLTRKA